MKRSGLIKDEIPKAKQLVKDGITVDELAMAFNIVPEAAVYWFEYFGGANKVPAPPEPPAEEKPKLTPKAKKDKEE